jgi:hypothetical protein
LGDILVANECKLEAWYYFLATQGMMCEIVSDPMKVVKTVLDASEEAHEIFDVVVQSFI